MAVFEEIIQPINEFGDAISERKPVECGGDIYAIRKHRKGWATERGPLDMWPKTDVEAYYCTKCKVRYEGLPDK